MTELTKARLRGSSNSNENIILTTKTNNIQDQENNQNQEKEIKQLLGIKTNSDFKNLREAKYKISDDLVQLILKTNLEVREEEKKHLKSQSHNLIKQIIQQKKPEISLEIFSEALKIVQDPEIYNARSKIHKTLGQYKEALEDFKLAAINGYKYSNEDCQFIEDIRIELRDKNLLNKEEMLSYLDQLISIIPNSSILYAARGNIYEDIREIEKANSDFDQALKINPNENWRNYEKANIIYLNSHNLEEALKFFQREREIQSSSDNKNQNLFAWKEATVRALSILIELLRKDEALLMIEELKDYADKNHDEELKESDLSVSEIDKINYFKEINPRYIKVIEQINNLNFQREKEFDFFGRAEIDDELIELANKIGDINAAKEYEERANIDFAKITPDQKVTDKVNEIIYNEYKENKVLKARRWCKRTDFLLTESERDKLAKIDNIKQKVLTKKDLSNEDLKQLIDAMFSDNNVARLEQPIFELSQIDSKYSKLFKALLGQVDFKLGRDQSAKKILDELQDSLKENKDFTKEEDLFIKKVKEDIFSHISSSKHKDEAKNSTLDNPTSYFLLFVACMVFCIAIMTIDTSNGNENRKKLISESIKKNSINLTEEVNKKITDEIFENTSQIIHDIQKQKNSDLYYQSFKEKIKNIIDSNLQVAQSNAVIIDYDKISDAIIDIEKKYDGIINIKNNNNSPNTSVKNNSSLRKSGIQQTQIA